MLHFALNHMTVAQVSYAELLALASGLGCVGIEARNDLAQPLFDGHDPAEAGRMARDRGLRIVGLSQVYPFNSWSEAVRDEVAALIRAAASCGAETISLIPRNDGTGLGNGERQANLRLALRAIKPMLEDAGMIALVEPLGFLRSSLRSKAETVDAIEAIDAGHVFRIVHDTFHHYLADGGPMFPKETGIIHISGVVDRSLSISEIEDEHRVLVDENDRLGNVEQIRRLLALGYAGPISMECFSPAVHALADPGAALARSFDYLRSELEEMAA